MKFLPLDDRYQALLTAILRTACDDVRSHCAHQRRPRTTSSAYGARKRKEYSHQTAVRSLAWLAGICPGELPIHAVCRALGLNHPRLLDRLDEAIGHTRFVELREMAQNLFARHEGAA